MIEDRTDAPLDMVHHLEQKAGISNDLLSNQDGRILQELLSHTNVRLNALDHEFQGDPSSIVRLLAERDRLLESAKRYRAALAPHKILPPEILSYIFRLALDREICLPLRRHSSLVPWSVSYVCSRWRQIALADPHLWANIAIHYSPSKSFPILNSIGNDIISRSSDYGISLACTEDPPILEDYSANVFTTQRELTTTHARRLVHLTMETTKAALVPYLESPPLQFTSLESIKLSIRGRYHFNDILTDKAITLFSNAPSLRKVTLNAFLQYRLFPNLLLVPWGQMTDLVLRQVVMPLETTLTLLRQCTNLTNCTFTLGDISDPVLLNPPRDISPITVPYLRSLTLQIDITTLAVHLLDSVSLPSLRALYIGPNPRGGVIPQALPQDALLSMLKRSRCELNSFTCKYRNEFDVHRVLQDMPELRSFSLTARYLGDPEIEAMSRGELLPKLEHIQCGLKSIHPFLDLLESSWSKADQSSKSTYKGLMSVNVWGYGLADQAGAHARIDKLRSQIEMEGRTVSILLGDGWTSST